MPQSVWALTLISLRVGAIAMVLSMPAADAKDVSTWQTQRQAEYTQWQATHTVTDAQIADLKAKTAALLEQHKIDQQAKIDARYGDLLKRSHALTSKQKKEAEALAQQASTAWQANDFAAAATLYKKSLDIDPANGDANYFYGDSLKHQGNLPEAAEYVARALAFPPPDARINKGVEYVQTGYFKAMIAAQSLPSPPDPRIGEPPAILRVADAPKEIWDAPDAPMMVIIPAGEYTMGAPPTEKNYQPTEQQHRVTIGYPLAVGKYDVTRGEFAAFVAATGYKAKNDVGCYTYADGKFPANPKSDWMSPGFEQKDNEPVVCVSYYDAIAYAAWLSHKTGHSYRLPSEAEWEYATRAGTTTMYYWGDELGQGHANCNGCYAENMNGDKRTTPGGTFPPNPFGLYDMTGNVWNWLADCWNNTYLGAPTDGSAWVNGYCQLRGRRGASWFNLAEGKPGDPRQPFRLRSAARFGSIPDIRYGSFGFRVVRDL